MNIGERLVQNVIFKASKQYSPAPWQICVTLSTGFGTVRGQVESCANGCLCIYDANNVETWINTDHVIVAWAEEVRQ
jgi:hypothetical protein